MASVSHPAGRFPLPVPVLLLISLALLVGMFLLAGQIQAALHDRANRDTAVAVEAFLAVVTPAPTGSYNAARLVSGVSSLAAASFWKGGLQVTVGRAAILPDTVGLMSRADTLLALPAEVTLSSSERASLVPFRTRDRTAVIGWVAVWGMLQPEPPDPLALIPACLVGIAVLGLVFAVWLRWSRRAFPGLVILGAVAGVCAALRLGVDVSQDATRATDQRLSFARHLLEMAATADGVRQHELISLTPELAPVVLRPPAERTDSVIRRIEDGSLMATIVAAVPDGRPIELRMLPYESRLTTFFATLMGCACLLALTLSAAARAGQPQRHI